MALQALPGAPRLLRRVGSRRPGGAARCWRSCCARWEERCWHAASENVTSWMLRLEMLICPAWVRIASVYVPVSSQSPYAGVRARVSPGLRGARAAACGQRQELGVNFGHPSSSRSEWFGACLKASAAGSAQMACLSSILWLHELFPNASRLLVYFFPVLVCCGLIFVLGAKAALLLGNRQQRL